MKMGFGRKFSGKKSPEANSLSGSHQKWRLTFLARVDGGQENLLAKL
jgi:hypothetical protein